ncbi:MAG: TIGR02186 family protein [Proteobacteria bacterium]|nr:TIGR02186 family protein [Pseudomonadota bacterium]
MKRAFFVTALLVLLPTAASPDELVSGLSQDLVEITSNYTGTDIVVFGAIESGNSAETPTSRDVVVVVRGPDSDMIVRRKARVAGIWINRDRITLGGMPSYYFVASTRPLSQIAPAQSLQRYQIGLANLVPKSESTHIFAKGEPFRHAVIRERERVGLYSAKPNGVEFLSYSLFRVRVPVPAGVPRGQYTAEVYLFSDGTVVSAQSTPLFVDQIGIERRIYNFAHEWPFAYGLAAVFMAMVLGWLSSLIFRER